MSSGGGGTEVLVRLSPYARDDGPPFFRGSSSPGGVGRRRRRPETASPSFAERDRGGKARDEDDDNDDELLRASGKKRPSTTTTSSSLSPLARPISLRSRPRRRRRRRPVTSTALTSPSSRISIRVDLTERDEEVVSSSLRGNGDDGAKTTPWWTLWLEESSLVRDALDGKLKVIEGGDDEQAVVVGRRRRRDDDDDDDLPLASLKRRLASELNRANNGDGDDGGGGKGTTPKKSIRSVVASSSPFPFDDLDDDSRFLPRYEHDVVPDDDPAIETEDENFEFCRSLALANVLRSRGGRVRTPATTAAAAAASSAPNGKNGGGRRRRREDRVAEREARSSSRGRSVRSEADGNGRSTPSRRRKKKADDAVGGGKPTSRRRNDDVVALQNSTALEVAAFLSRTTRRLLGGGGRSSSLFDFPSMPPVRRSVEMRRALATYFERNVGRGLWRDEIGSPLARSLDASATVVRGRPRRTRRVKVAARESNRTRRLAAALEKNDDDDAERGRVGTSESRPAEGAEGRNRESRDDDAHDFPFAPHVHAAAATMQRFSRRRLLRLATAQIAMSSLVRGYRTRRDLAIASASARIVQRRWRIRYDLVASASDRIRSVVVEALRRKERRAAESDAATTIRRFLRSARTESAARSALAIQSSWKARTFRIAIERFVLAAETRNRKRDGATLLSAWVRGRNGRRSADETKRDLVAREARRSERETELVRCAAALGAVRGSIFLGTREGKSCLRRAAKANHKRRRGGGHGDPADAFGPRRDASFFFRTVVDEAVEAFSCGSGGDFPLTPEAASSSPFDSIDPVGRASFSNWLRRRGLPEEHVVFEKYRSRTTRRRRPPCGSSLGVSALRRLPSAGDNGKSEARNEVLTRFASRAARNAVSNFRASNPPRHVCETCRASFALRHELKEHLLARSHDDDAESGRRRRGGSVSGRVARQRDDDDERDHALHVAAIFEIEEAVDRARPSFSGRFRRRGKKKKKDEKETRRAVRRLRRRILERFRAAAAAAAEADARSNAEPTAKRRRSPSFRSLLLLPPCPAERRRRRRNEGRIFCASNDEEEGRPHGGASNEEEEGRPHSGATNARRSDDEAAAEAEEADFRGSLSEPLPDPLDVDVVVWCLNSRGAALFAAASAAAAHGDEGGTGERKEVEDGGDAELFRKVRERYGRRRASPRTIRTFLPERGDDDDREGGRRRRRAAAAVVDPVAAAAARFASERIVAIRARLEGFVAGVEEFREVRGRPPPTFRGRRRRDDDDGRPSSGRPVVDNDRPVFPSSAAEEGEEDDRGRRRRRRDEHLRKALDGIDELLLLASADVKKRQITLNAR